MKNLVHSIKTPATPATTEPETIRTAKRREHRAPMPQFGARLFTRIFGLAVVAFLLSGCLPEEYLWWSPDGQTAALRTGEGLRLAGTNGQLSAVVLPGFIESAAWLPDGSRLIVSRSFNLTNWTAVEKLIPANENDAVRALARGIPELLKAGLTVSGGIMKDLDDKFLKPLGLSEKQALEPAWFCALDLHRDQIQAVVAGFTNAAALEAEIVSTQTNGLSVHEITILPMRDGQPAGEPRALVRSLYPLMGPVISPHYPVVAFRAGEGALKAIALEGTNSLLVADENVAAAAWSVDGRSLIHWVVAKNETLGEICSGTVVSASGELLREPSQKDTLAIAAAMTQGGTGLSVLPDGHILFASASLTLPMRKAFEPSGTRFFLLDPASTNAAPVAVPVKEGSLPEDLSTFAVSPDGRLVAIVESGTDAVAVFELNSGKVKIISPAHEGWKSRLIPAWRSSQQLTFGALPSAAAARPELLMWQADAPVRILSKDWPAELAQLWLEGPDKNSSK